MFVELGFAFHAVNEQGARFADEILKRPSGYLCVLYRAAPTTWTTSPNQTTLPMQYRKPREIWQRTRL